MKIAVFSWVCQAAAPLQNMLESSMYVCEESRCAAETGLTKAKAQCDIWHF